MQALDLPVLAVEEISGWLDGRTSANTAVLTRLNQQEAELRTDQKARDAALAALAQAQGAEQMTRQVDQQAREALIKASQATLTARQQQSQQTTQALNGLLAQLDAVLQNPECRNDWCKQWRDAWTRAPAEFRQARQQEAITWQGQHDAHEAQARKLEALAGQISAAAGLLTKTVDIEAQARTTAQHLAAQLNDKRQDGAQCLAGKPVTEVKAA